MSNYSKPCNRLNEGVASLREGIKPGDRTTPHDFLCTQAHINLSQESYVQCKLTTHEVSMNRCPVYDLLEREVYRARSRPSWATSLDDKSTE